MRRGRVVSYGALFVGDPSGGKTWPEWNELLTSRLSGRLRLASSLLTGAH